MKKRLILIGLVVIVAASIAYFLLHRKTDDPGILLSSGNVEVTEVDLGFKVPGRVETLLTDEGRNVVAGGILAKLDRTQLLRQMEAQQAVIDSSSARLLELQRGSRPQEKKSARSLVSSASADLEKAGKDFERAEMLFKNGAIPAQQRDSAKRTFEVAKAQYDQALQNESLVNEGPRSETIKAAEAQVRQPRAQLAVYLEQLADMDLKTPVQGVVLRKNVEAGETVTAGTPIFTVGDLTHPWVKIYVKEDKLGLVKLGQKAEVTVDTYPGKKFDGVVTYISSEAEFTPKNVQTQEERVKLVFGVKVSVDNPNQELKPGMPADVKIRVR
ncbi:efflux RND transporter periplasmic adaptor subunit [Geobacter sulfurreducens subsp. ethanolicus]|uniref:Efflux RND transporter periplasmic adaptor subunit n=1 Tax=Geomobilimonas luticola TaxID=1114878 RepID=A0ABS5SBH7_9BACT|nr:MULTISPECIES: efflux RND transporter periplasmic adaptor subunit [Geobacteraceae]MBT0652520.1 efflux RND transporter periplasmic adaptor subunit [Geomobilimonas luticola]BEH08971.1 efflux RND transporter periplasmic adaptor subunit [Geobacter sulfurreducens subsp. ethanolicus]